MNVAAVKTKDCPTCKKSFGPCPSKRKQQWDEQKYCSQACSSKARVMKSDEWRAEEGAKAYPPATGIEAKVCQWTKNAGERGQVSSDAAWIICREIAARQRLGVKKYGQTLADNHAPIRARLRHALEEALDLSVYSQWAVDGGPAERERDKRLTRITGLAIAAAAQLVDMMVELEKEESPMLTTEGGQP